MLAGLIGISAVLCLIYYGVIVVYAGFGTAFAGIWLLLAGFFGLTAASVLCYQKAPDRFPLWIPVSLVTLCASGALILFILQILIFGRIPSVAEPGLDYVIVLGGRIKPEGITTTLRLRLEKAAEYAAQNPDTILVLSGARGSDEPQSEASFMRDYLVKEGVAPERMILEEQSRSTTENMAYSRLAIEREEPLGKAGEARVGIITNNFHLFRARMIAARQGMKQVWGIAAGSDKILLIHFSVRDSLAILKDRLMGNL